MKEYLERASYTWSEDSIRFINTPTQKARSKFFYVQEVGYFKTKPPYFTERQNLNSYLIVYTISGRGILKYGGRKYPVYPGQAFYIHCIPWHYYACMEGEEWEILWLHFNGNTARGYYEEFIQNGFRQVRVQDSFFMESTMRRILSLTIKKDIHSELICSNLIVNLLTELMIRSSSDKFSLTAMPDSIKAVLKDLENHFLEPFSLDETAGRTGLSKYHLSREFRKYVGTTMNEYVITMRLNYAKELLRYSNEPVGEIAFACGMNHVSHFINLFKEREGTTPLQYRKEWGSNGQAL
ncbi:AraC family transcriptional regulator [Lachnospiraceae bacterium]|nr:AraC family transcriptional regulator [Lachnospiraceae bacterium]